MVQQIHVRTEWMYPVSEKIVGFNYFSNFLLNDPANDVQQRHELRFLKHLLAIVCGIEIFLLICTM